MEDPKWKWILLAAKQGVFSGHLEIDEDVKVSVAEDGTGAWIRAWVWVGSEK